MVNIQQIKDIELNNRIESHEKIGGALRISVFEIKENYLGQLPNEYDAHLVTARQTLEVENFKANFHFNKVALKNERKSIAYAQTDFNKLDPSGVKIDLHHFLGPHYDLERRKPIVHGRKNDTLNLYFYYDEDEAPGNNINMNKLVADHLLKYPDNRGCFIYALMEPPYGISLEKEIVKRGEYVNDFLEYFFNDTNTITIYAWNTDCSAVFEPGNEWWGNYFWTIYNPVKQWYIGIIASETD